MPERILPGLGIRGFYDPGQNDWGDTLSEDLRVISAVVHLNVLSRTTTLPTSPNQGMRYIVPPGEANENAIAVFDDGLWRYVSPEEGWRAWVRDTATWARWDGSSWITDDTTLPAFGATESDNVLKVNATGDALEWDAVSGGVLPVYGDGNPGDALKLNATGDGIEWGEVEAVLPAGGTAGQVLALNSAEDGYEWQDVPTGLPNIGTLPEGLGLVIGPTGAIWSDLRQIVLPSYGPAEAGRVLGVSPDGTTVQWSVSAASVLPAYDSTFGGQILTVNQDGTALTWSNPTSTIPLYGPTQAGYLLSVSSGGTSISWLDPESLSELPEYTPSEEGLALVVNNAGELEWGTQDLGGSNVTEVTNTSYLAQNSDFSGRQVRLLNFAGNGQFTIPAGLTQTEPLTLIRTGPGEVDLVAGSGVTINTAAPGLRMRVNWASVTVVPIASDTYVAIGDMVQAL